jgi:hypothetical protein
VPLDFSRFQQAYYDSQSVSSLAEQPIELPGEAREGADWDLIFPALQNRLQSLKNWRWSWWSYWAEVATYTLPRRYHWLVTPNTYDRGRPINDAILDGTALDAVTVCASGLWSGLTSPSRPWKNLGVALPWVSLDAAALEWLDDANQRLDVVLAGSNFYQTMAQAFQDVAVFGTAPVIIYDDADRVINCYLPCCGEYMLAVGSTLTVDTIYREFNATVLSIVQMFGLENCPSQVRERWAQGGGALDREFAVCCAIEPNIAMRGRGARSEIRVVPGVFPWREVHWLRDVKTERELSRKGFWEKPFFAARWAVTANDPYGRSPGMQALGDNKQLQYETRRKAEYLEKGVRPPMGAHPSLKNQPSSIHPGDITYAPIENGKEGFWPLFMPNPQWMEPLNEDLEGIRKRIQTAFFVPTFLAITQMEGIQPRNELEITKRDLERLQVLGPFINLFETECASPAIMRILAIMERRRLLLPRPPSLRGVPLKLEYRSIMKIAQEAAETASMERLFQVAGAMSLGAKDAGRPDPGRIVKWDDMLRQYGRLVNVHESLFFSQNEVMRADQTRAQQAQQAQALQLTQPAVEAAQGLSNTQIGGGKSALEAILGT